MEFWRWGWERKTVWVHFSHISRWVNSWRDCQSNSEREKWYYCSPGLVGAHLVLESHILGGDKNIVTQNILRVALSLSLTYQILHLLSHSSVEWNDSSHPTVSPTDQQKHHTWTYSVRDLLCSRHGGCRWWWCRHGEGQTPPCCQGWRPLSQGSVGRLARGKTREGHLYLSSPVDIEEHANAWL